MLANPGSGMRVLPKALRDLQVPCGELADIFVAESIEVGLLVLLQVCVTGGQLASLDYVASDGQQSWSLGYRKAVKTKRFIATTFGFRTKNRKAYQTLQHCCKATASGRSHVN